MTNFPIIVHSKFIYVKLQALIWRGDGLRSPQILHPSTGKMLKAIHELEPDKPLIINSINVISVEHYSLSWFEEIKTCQILFFNASAIQDDLKKWITDNNTKTEFGGTFTSNDSLIEFIELGLSEEEDEIQKIIEKSFIHNPGKEMKRLSSTPIKSNGIYNAREIIRKPNAFSFLTVQMALGLQGLISECKASRPRIIALSIRSSAFAAAVSLLTESKIELIDHIGPNFKMLEGTKFNFKDPKDDYFILADYVLGGTELKSANAIASYSGCSIKGAIAIGTLLKPEEYNLPFKLIALSSRQLNEIGDAKYSL